MKEIRMCGTVAQSHKSYEISDYELSKIEKTRSRLEKEAKMLKVENKNMALLLTRVCEELIAINPNSKLAEEMENFLDGDYAE